MLTWRALRLGLRNLLRPRTADQEAKDEVRHYLDQAVAEHLAAGLSPTEALRAARVDLGSATAARDDIRGVGWERVVDGAAADIRYAFRALRKTPVFTGIAVLVIALGTGSVTTIFSAMNAIVLRPLPGTADPARLVQIDRRRPDEDDGIQASVAYYHYLRQSAKSFEGIAGWSKANFALSQGGEGIAVYGNVVSGNYFGVLGVKPALGRFFSPDEDDIPLAHSVIVISHAFWRAKLAADSTVVGRTVSVNGRAYTIVGVAPADFHGVFTPILVEAWVPLAMRRHLRPGRDDDQATWLWTFGRLSATADRRAAQAELVSLTGRYVAAGSEPVTRARYTTIRLSAMTGLPADARAMAVGFIGLLLAVAVLVLLIASINVGSMISARSLGRRRELAVRAALGAGRGRLVRQLLTEVLLLFAAGAVGGVILAFQATAGLERISIPADVPLVLEISPDLRVFAFALLTALGSGLLFGLGPALRASRTDLADRLREGAPGSGTRRRFFGNSLIVGQLASSLVLLVVAGLLLRALARGTNVDPGFRANGVATVSFNTEAWGYDSTRSEAFYRTLRDPVAAIPGVTSVSFVARMPLAFETSGARIHLRPTNVGAAGLEPGEPIQLSLVGAEFFETLGIGLLEGRPIQPTDDQRSPSVAVVNQTFGRRFFPAGSAVGRSFWWSGTEVTIVGVARDAKYGSLSETTPAFAYFSLAQRPTSDRVLLVRSTLGNEVLTPAVRAAVSTVDPTIPPPVLIGLAQANAIVLLPQRFAAIVTGALGAVGLLLATVGLYGTLAYTVGRRTREIGLRMALGATRRQVVDLVLKGGLRLALLGVLVGLVLAASITRFLASLLIATSPYDPFTFLGTALLLLGAAGVASYLPARRAARADPMEVLRVD